jgi:Amt family ammonium transporter
MTPGFFLCGGMVGKKNIISTMLQRFMAMIIVTVLWGYRLTYGLILQLVVLYQSLTCFQGVGTNTA